LTSKLAKPADAPKNIGPLASKALSGAAPMVASMKTGASIENRLPAMLPPQQQSSQYADLQKKLNAYYTQNFQTDEQRNREFLKLLRAKEEADKAGTATTRPTGLPTPVDYRAMSQRLATSPKGLVTDPREIARSLQRPKPMRIDSLAVGVKAEGLSRLLSGAEKMMQDGRYIAALDQYEAAQELSRTSNPMITLGRAHAELAVGNYRRAERDIRAALLNDPVLTMAQFDLKKMIGEARLEAIAKDLKQIAQRQPDDAGIPLLLAYVAYNSGHEDQAAIYLDASQKRSSARDPLFKLLWTHWSLPNLPSTQPAAPAGK
jgi:tetratricopeptide (TPR) repeat protein